MTFTRFTRIAIAVACALNLAAMANAALIHRYSFSGSTVSDSVGKINGALKGSAKIADGKLILDNTGKNSTDEKLSYLEFDSSILPKAGSASIVIWFTAKEDGNFARVINFGTTSEGIGSAFIYFTPRTADDQARVAISATDTASKTYIDVARLDDGKPHCAAIIIDGASKKLRLFVDGKPAGTPQDLGDNTLDKVKATSNWVGKSSFDNDAGLSGTVDELRVYDQALTAEEVTAIQKAGPDALPPPAH